MPQTFKDAVNAEMALWFQELEEKRKVPTGEPRSSKIETEILHLTQEEYQRFVKNPQEFVHIESSDNSNGNTDPLFLR